MNLNCNDIVILVFVSFRLTSFDNIACVCS